MTNPKVFELLGVKHRHSKDVTKFKRNLLSNITPVNMSYLVILLL